MSGRALAERLRLTMIVDNSALDPRLAPEWGLAVLAEVEGEGRRARVLFDTGSSGAILERNARILGVDLGDIDAVFISHWHGDHTGGLRSVLRGARRPIKLLSPEPARLSGVTVIAAESPCLVLEPAVFSTGRVIFEHAMAIPTPKGLVVLVGCSHPGADVLVEKAIEATGVEEVHLVVGGFHLATASEGRAVARKLDELGVELLAPCHCTSESAIEGMREVYGGRLLRVGAGWRMEVKP